MINESLKEVRDMLETAMGSSVVKSFYAGDVGLPYKDALPAVIVRERYTKVERKSTAKDQYRHGLSILVVMDMRRDIATAGLTNDIVAHKSRLRDLMEEADTDGAPKTTTVLGALMKQSNIRGTNYVYNLDPYVDYNPAAPGDFFYVAAEITLDVVTEIVTRKA